MRALWYMKPGQVEVKDSPQPTPSAGEALVRVSHAGICGSDLTIAAGKHLTARPPLVLGHEFSGELVRINTAETGGVLRPGDKVTVFPLLSCGRCLSCRTGNQHVCRELGLIGIKRDGGMAEYVSVPATSLIKLDARADLRLAALAEPMAVAVHALRESSVSLGDHVLILGGGPIGALIALVLRHCGIQQLMVSEIQPFRKRILRELSFEVIDPTETDLVQESHSRTNQEGVDVVFEASGADAAALKMTDCVRPRGEIIVVSIFKRTVPIDLRKVAYKEIALKGIRVYTKGDFERAAQLVTSGQLPLSKVVTHEYPIGQSVEGFRLLTAGADALKVLIACS